MTELEFPKLTTKEITTSITDVLHPKTPGIHLQQRDHHIIKFILEQKFCTLEAIYFRFFDQRISKKDPLPKNLWVARQRLSKLRSLALIKTEKVLSSGKAHYLITAVGYKFVKAHAPESELIKPTAKIDFGLYEHDTRITLSRVFTELNGKSKKWYSEKWLKSNPIKIGDYKHKFSKDLRPDAVLISSKDELVAFELEASKKSLKRIREKVELYNGLLQKADSWISDRPKILDKVWIVATSASVCQKYKLAISQLQNRNKFRVDIYDAIVPECARTNFYNQTKDEEVTPEIARV